MEISLSQPVPFEVVLGLLALLQLKHMLADFFLQTPMMLGDRGKYVHPGRALHCTVHAVGSLLAFVIIGVPFGLMLVIVLAEWVVHFHIDWGKGRWSDLKKHGPTDAGYWRAFGADQALHQLTYVVMLWAAFPAL